MSSSRLYDELAWTWEILVSEDDFASEASFIRKMVEKYGNSGGNLLLDVGCGAGHHDVFLKENFDVVGVDGSEKMLELALKRNPEIEYHQADMRSFDLNRKFDVVMAFDMIMYNLTCSDLKTTLTNLNRHLKPGGVLLFYMENWKERFEQNKTRFKKQGKGDVEIVLIENDYDPDPDDTEFECHLIFLIRTKGELQTTIDKHRMGLFELKQVLEILKDLNFRVLLFDLDFSGRKFQKEGPVFVCQKLS
jgi:SAM-dependent methyltransferase